MKKLALILGSSIALTATAFAQTAADVSATDALNNNARNQDDENYCDRDGRRSCAY